MWVYPTGQCPISRGWILGVHAGIDIACPLGTPVVAVDDATVSIVAFEADGYGNWIELQHAGGTATRYGHLSAQLVQPGEMVSRAETIGIVGSTGRSTGPHLHFEVLIGGAKVDPAPWLDGLGPVVGPGDRVSVPEVPRARGECRVPLLGSFRL